MAPRMELLSLLRAAKEDLDDVPRRLILADWLEENGDDVDQGKAALLRSQVVNPTAWFPCIDWYPGIESMRFRMSGTSEGLLRVHAPARTLATRRGEELAGSEEWAWVADLTVSPCTPNGLKKLVESGILSAIPSLTFTDAGLDASGATALARLEDDGFLRHLDLDSCCIEPNGLRRLLKSPFLPRLESLGLSGNRLLPISIRELADAPLSRLRRLRLARNQLRESPGLLARAGWAVGLRDLDLSSGRVNQAGLLGLLECALPELKRLDLAHNDLGDAALAALAQSDLMAHLEDLSLDGCPITARGLGAIGESPRVPRLHTLRIGYRENGDELAAQVARSPWASTLVWLIMHHSGLTATGATALAESEYLGNLKVLIADINGIPAQAVARLRERFGRDVVTS